MHPRSILCLALLAGCVPHPSIEPSPRVPEPSGSIALVTPDTSSPAAARRDSAAPLARAAAAIADTAMRTSASPIAGPAVPPADVSRLAEAVFGDPLARTGAGDADPAAAPAWDMDVRSYETQDRVAHYVAAFTGRSRERIVERLERGTRYEPMIRAKLRAGGLPEDMYYLALVESGFDPHAYSRAAAVGMWQFMTSTARGMGMRVDWWVDERRDPVRSTTAAVQFIRGLRDQFGSLYLAAAAYNGGPGRIARGVARYAEDLETAQGEDAFFVLAGKDYLKNETREYVPQLIAAALIAREPVRYGMTLRPRAAFVYDSVRVPASTPLAAVARAASASVAAIQELNPHFLRGMTPPRAVSLVRVPVGSATGFAARFSALDAVERTAFRRVLTKKGDTMDRIADRQDVSASALAGFNPHVERTRRGRLVAGQELIVPTAHVLAAALSVPDPGIERHARSAGRLKLHTVKRGESLGRIAKRYATSTSALMRLNRLKKPVIFPGQTLVVAGEPKRPRERVVTLPGSPRSASAAGAPRLRRAVAGRAGKSALSKRTAARAPAKRPERKAARRKTASRA